MQSSSSETNPNVLYFAVSISSPCGLFWGLEWLTSAVFETGDLLDNQDWSTQELALLFFLQAGMAAQYGIQPGMQWDNIVGLLGGKPIPAKLHALTVRELSVSHRQPLGNDARQLCTAYHYLAA